MNFDQIINNIENKELFIFGTGSLYSKYEHFLSRKNIVGYLDNNEKLWGSQFNNKNVFNPKEVVGQKDVFIIILSSYYEEISAQLESYGLVQIENFCTYLDIANSFDLSLTIENGHFYSPIPSNKEIFSDSYVPYERNREMLGIDLNIDVQLRHLDKAFNLVNEFSDFLLKDKRFYLKNDNFEYLDAITLYSFLKEYKPNNVIEIGSGFTSALFLDTVEYLKYKTKLTFIEPYPKRLNKLLEDSDYIKTNIINERVQTVSINFFDQLGENDILFIDSSHVSKIESDVNYLFFEVLPNLNEGTIIHIHDIFKGFEYPEDWTYQGRFWNESYLLRSFLQFNHSFEVLFWNNYMYSEFKDRMPSTCIENVNNDFGGSIWLRKIK
ncbi:class I SAM-dependent methyltransferase [Psychrobacillus sp. L3]|uniref:class I SAM-dependent methyltransferase n=1 Tax=Psychrobacillus sp. L3 TaxID=3236891 RepID=UPI0036F26F6B